jgi:3-dehydroquinate synthase
VTPTTLTVPLAERSYEILIGRGLYGSLAGLFEERLGGSRHLVLVADSQVAGKWGQVVSEPLSAAGFRVSLFVLPSGEKSKSPAQAAALWQFLVDQRADRGSTVVALGGGVVGDLAGFAAATYARGLALVQLPTTLLSQVDSSVGGKTGINLPSAKNMVGCFWQPRLVVIDTDSLATLPRREFLSGMAEVIKYGVILKPELFDYLEEHVGQVLALEPTAITHIVAESCRAKADVVSQDERETTGLRAILNYGHTFAHAVESDTGYGELLHGEAVAIGMHLAAQCAVALGRVPEAFVERQKRLLELYSLPTSLPAAGRAERLWDLMQHDKKVHHGRLRFVLPTRLGHVELVPDVTQELVLAVLRANERVSPVAPATA